MEAAAGAQEPSEGVPPPKGGRAASGGAERAAGELGAQPEPEPEPEPEPRPPNEPASDAAQAQGAGGLAIADVVERGLESPNFSFQQNIEFGDKRTVHPAIRQIEAIMAADGLDFDRARHKLHQQKMRANGIDPATGLPTLPEPEPEPEPEPRLPELRRKVADFLGEVPIGAPGPKGATSRRTFDPTPIVQFAASAGLWDASAEEIYAAFVLHKSRAGEAALGLEPEPEPEGSDFATLDCLSGPLPELAALQAYLQTICPSASDTVARDVQALCKQAREEWRQVSQWLYFVGEGADKREIWVPYPLDFCKQLDALQPGKRLKTPDGKSRVELTKGGDDAEAEITNVKGAKNRRKARKFATPEVSVTQAIAWHAASEGDHALLKAALAGLVTRRPKSEGARRDFRWPSRDRGGLLHAACKSGSVSCIRLLLDPRAELEQLSWQQLLRLAKVSGVVAFPASDRGQVFNALLQLRDPVDWTLRDIDGKTATDIAGTLSNANLTAQLAELIALREFDYHKQQEREVVREKFDNDPDGAQVLVGWTMELLSDPESGSCAATVYGKIEPTRSGAFFSRTPWENRVAIHRDAGTEWATIDFKRLRVTTEFTDFALRRRVTPAELDVVIRASPTEPGSPNSSGGAGVSGARERDTLRATKRVLEESQAFLPRDLSQQLRGTNVYGRGCREELLQQALEIEGHARADRADAFRALAEEAGEYEAESTVAARKSETSCFS